MFSNFFFRSVLASTLVLSLKFPSYCSAQNLPEVIYFILIKKKKICLYYLLVILFYFLKQKTVEAAFCDQGEQILKVLFTVHSLFYFHF
jgi:hypothetical protein